MPLSTSQILILVWFGSAIFVEITSGFVLALWLSRRGVRLVFGLTGMPGYLERAYLKWCRSQGRSGKDVLVLRVLSMVNVIVAAIVTIPFLIRH
jgi:type IV secretory pathway TraG/TraD family ATPase VirD4